MRRWYAPAEVLKMARRINGELLALSGPRNPYPGQLGIIEVGALADLLLVDGDPITNLDLVADPHKNFLVIMKGERSSRTLSCRSGRLLRCLNRPSLCLMSADGEQGATGAYPVLTRALGPTSYFSVSL